ncbi:two-component sensor histidine kinase [Sphaerisporangium siamense]|uniref:histidine kinase n=1 Tax=Sphaerisporangium siamense TaxID=795645 RepID=A0A7W7GBC0_9ACTN|nr:HAMP domain-containing sensor histidine kinase [Sphaerisporangium siamense]MBB4700841.1 two-component system sensor histidine kinase MtrB [Sphaerisporangium siamense]GII86013.1 two-component sensor histidine kinase [Sphaerisporangium siamense]
MRLGRRRPTGLRVRLVITFILVAVTASALVAGIGYQLVRRALLERAENGATMDVRDVLQRISLPIGTSDLLWPTDSAVSENDLNALAESLDGPDRQVILRYGDRERLSSGTTLGLADVPAELRQKAATRMVRQRLMIKNEPWLLIGTQVHRLTRTGAVRPTGMTVFVFVSLKEEEGVLVRLRTALAQSSGITLAIALTVALVSARSVLLPVRRLGEAARALGAGRLDTRLPVHGRDELTDLTATFNDTASALEQTVSELRALEAMSRRFVADVSHELRTPLTAMTAVTDMLTEEAQHLPPDAGKAVDIVVREIDRLRVLVEHLIEASKLDSGTALLIRENVDVGVALADCLEIRGWTGRVRLDDARGLSFSLDPRRFDVIVANLVGNALRHGAPPVTVAARRLRSGLEVKVRDRGKGIPREDLPHVFERFYKVGAGRARSEGSGLGLAIAKANAELHGGTIRVELCDPGTQFTLWIPHP